MPSWCSGRSDTIRRSGVPGPATTPPQAGAVTAPLAARAASRAGAPPPPAARVTHSRCAVGRQGARRVADADDGGDAVGPRVDPGHRAARGVGDPDAPAGHRDAAGAGADVDRSRRVPGHAPEQPILGRRDPERPGAGRKAVELGGGDRDPVDHTGAPRDPRELEAAASAGDDPRAVTVRGDAAGGLEVGHDRRCAGPARIDEQQAVVAADRPQRGGAQRHAVEREPSVRVAGRQVDRAEDRARVRCEPEHLPRARSGRPTSQCRALPSSPTRRRDPLPGRVRRRTRRTSAGQRYRGRLA